MLGLLSVGPFLARGAEVGPVTDSAAADSALRRIQFLRTEIARNDELYHRKAEPEISDFDYDRLKDELTVLEERFPKQAAQLGASPVRSVGDDRVPGFSTYRHGERMLSLEKTYSEGGLRSFAERTGRALEGEPLSFTVEPKFDGLAVSATYENGRLTHVVTRGDGFAGDDVTANARHIQALRPQLKITVGTAPKSIELRGEVYLSYAEFRRINREREEEGEAGHSSPRNLAAGTLKSRDPFSLADRKLEIVFYGIGACEPAEMAPPRQSALLAQLRAWGLPTVENFKQAKSVDEICEAVRELAQARPKLTYPIDGVVVKVDSVAAQQRLGATDHAPRWAIAYKISPERATTRLEGITFQVGRTGIITPVAELEPVQLGSAWIRRATLHNAAEISRRDLRVGDRVVLERMGGVIPAIVSVDHDHRGPGTAPFVFPSRCPDCGGPLVQRDGEVAWRCVNFDCPAQLRRRLEHFASPAGVKIKGLGESTIAALVDRGLVHGIADLYRLRQADLSKLPRGSDRSRGELIAAIAATKHAELSRFVYGLGIPGVGRSAAKTLARRFDTLDAMAGAGEAEVRKLDGFGEESARAVAAFFAAPGTQQLLADLRSLGVVPAAHPTGVEIAEE